MNFAIDRIVVQASVLDKAGFVDKAKALGVSLSELMRRAASQYDVSAATADTLNLTQAERLISEAAERAARSIDDTLAYLAGSELRIQARERQHAARHCALAAT